MLFPTFDFLLFVLPVLVVFWALSHRPLARVVLLLVASYWFYVAGPKNDPLPTPWYYVGLLVGSTFLDFYAGRFIHRYTPDLHGPDPVRAAKAKRARNLLLTFSLGGNLGLLGYYKYVDFFVATAQDIAHLLGLDFVAPHMATLLPLGISFYTFQSMSYTIDVWRERLEPEPSLLKFSLFVTFFPQLVAGPIVRANELLPQLHRRPRMDARRMEEGMFLVVKGLAKKVILGDFISGRFTDLVFSDPGGYTSLEILVALYAFTVQLYADFSGYSDIAIGVAKLMGYDIPDNFDRPYQSKNLGEFWRRWHMTLSTWLRDYLFFPLGGSKGSPARTYFNLWLTMILVGMWHYKPGTSWNFVIYANLHAAAMVFNRWNRVRDRDRSPAYKAVTWTLGASGVGLVCGVAAHLALGIDATTSLLLGAFAAVMFVVVTVLPETGTPFNAALHILLTFHFTVLSRVFFRAPDFASAKVMCARLVAFDAYGLRDGLLTPSLWAALAFGLLYHFTPRAWVEVHLWNAFRRIPGPVLGILFAGFCYVLMKILASGPHSFIYFNF